MWERRAPSTIFTLLGMRMPPQTFYAHFKFACTTMHDFVIKTYYFSFVNCMYLLNIIVYWCAPNTTCAQQIFQVHSTQTDEVIPLKAPAGYWVGIIMYLWTTNEPGISVVAPFFQSSRISHHIIAHQSSHHRASAISPLPRTSQVLTQRQPPVIILDTKHY